MQNDLFNHEMRCLAFFSKWSVHFNSVKLAERMNEWQPKWKAHYKFIASANNVPVCYVCAHCTRLQLQINWVLVVAWRPFVELCSAHLETPESSRPHLVWTNENGYRLCTPMNRNCKSRMHIVDILLTSACTTEQLVVRPHK